jgi:anion-transporting  ArsA/GET3 family ATPase
MKTTRLVKYLRTQEFHLERLIVNQLISMDSKAAYWNSLIKGQQRILSRIKENVTDRPLVQIPYLGAEIEGLQGTRKIYTNSNGIHCCVLGVKQLSIYLDDQLKRSENKAVYEWLLGDSETKQEQQREW